MPDPALLFDSVTKAFEKRGSRLSLSRLRGSAPEVKRTVAINDVSLRVARGEIFGVLGANGSGKSTLIRLVSTLLLPDAGDIRVFGHDVEKDEIQVKRLISRVSVEAAFFKTLSPLENLLYAGRLYGLSGEYIRTRSIEILERLGIERHRVFEPLEEMSRGMQQKVAIARGFLTAPVLMLLDEPTTGLDPRSKREVQQFVRELRDTHDATVLLTTHDMEEADRLCDRIAVLNDGRIAALDTPAALRAGTSAALGAPATLEDAFMHITGQRLEDGELVATPG